jgi:hypothetical protein
VKVAVLPSTLSLAFDQFAPRIFIEGVFMKVWQSILLTLGLFILCAILEKITHISVTMFMVLGTALWIAIDSTKIELVKYKSGISYGPIVLFFACVGVWFLGFPWYLIVRGKIKNGEAVLKNAPESAAT